MKQAVLGAKIFDGDSFYHQHALIYDNNNIIDIVSLDKLPPSIKKVELKGGTLAPGFIDLQVNGGGGVLFNNNTTAAAINTIVKSHRSVGTTSIMLTLITDQHECQNAAVDAYNNAVKESVSGLLGLHFEGPFFNLQRRGVHKQEWIRSPSQQDIDWLISLKNIRLMVTLAPECVSEKHLKSLTSAGVQVSIGHTQANFEQANKAIDNGARCFTHLYNAMEPLKSREPGVVGAALTNSEAWCSIIVDGHHVHHSVVSIAYAMKPKGKLFFVSDAMATVGSNNKSFELYDEHIEEKQGCLVNKNGNLAGSAIGIIDAIKIAVNEVRIPLDEALKMASRYPAELMKVDTKLGFFKKNFNVDMVHFGDDFIVKNTWVSGEKMEH